MAVRAPDGALAGQLQHRVSQAHPNVAAFDTRMWVRTFATVLEQAAAIVRFMAWLGIVGGLLVLAGLVPASRHDRRAEEALLHTLGATRRQIKRIMVAEYTVLGSSAALTGLILAWATGWVVARWLLDLPYRPTWSPLIWIPLSITAATLVVGYAMTAGTRRRS